MVAQRLARHCGLDYAIMSGGDVAPLGARAVTEIHKLFTWAKSSKKGLLLFIDEAEAFLGTRSRGDVSEHMRNVLSALLYQTGTQSHHYMLVLATNRPGDLDRAITDRMDETVEFPMPTLDERKRLVSRYFSEYILSRAAAGTKNPLASAASESKGSDEPVAAAAAPAPRSSGVLCFRKEGPSPITVEGITREALANVATVTKGFSGRAMSKFMLNLQGAVYADPKCRLTAELLKEVTAQELSKHRARTSSSGDWLGSSASETAASRRTT